MIKRHNLFSFLVYSYKSYLLREAAVVSSKWCMIVNKSILYNVERSICFIEDCPTSYCGLISEKGILFELMNADFSV
jgi:hypothetical protein